MDERTAVLVVGGGLSGLTTAALLAHHGVPCLLVERHPGTSIQYKFAGISPRSMEIFRGLGLEQEIRTHRTGDQQGGGIARARNLSDPEIQWTRMAWPDASEVSPTQPATCDQHVLEPILRARASELGADVRFGMELVGLEERDDRVEARIRERSTGAERTVESDYLVAADGANGTLHARLGIARTGIGALQNWMNIIFETDLPDTLQGKRFTSCFVTDLNGTFTPRGRRWLLALQYFPERGERPEDFDDARCRELVQRGAGRADVEMRLVDARPWEVSACVADRFSTRRCFLVGDAAHLMPPTGAFGGNTGIHDAHNLAWKLALAARGRASPALLESYDTERRALAERTLAQALARLARWFRDPRNRLPPAVPLADDYDVVLGQRYDRGALIPEEGADIGAPFANHRELSGRPGTRAPHLPLDGGDGPPPPLEGAEGPPLPPVGVEGQPLPPVGAEGARSTIDLFHRDFVLIAPNADNAPSGGRGGGRSDAGPGGRSSDGRHGGAWSDAARTVSARAGIAIRCVDLGRPGEGFGVADDAWPRRFGLAPGGAALVRPDGFVAWRSHEAPADPVRSLEAVLKGIGVRLP